MCYDFSIMSYFSDPTLSIEVPASNDPSMVKINLHGHGESAARVAGRLITGNSDETPFLFAGHHMGMARQDVWAMTRGGEPIETHVPAILDHVQSLRAVISDTVVVSPDES